MTQIQTAGKKSVLGFSLPLLPPPSLHNSSSSNNNKQPITTMATPAAFTSKLSPAALKFFQDRSNEPFSKQACYFLNAYWPEIGNQADFIFSVAWEQLKKADMHTKGVMYIHLYEEGNTVDFNVGLYFYEKLVQFVLESPDGKIWKNDPKYKPSMPEMMTAIVRKQELREKVDVDFDGRISFLEYLLYQYREFCNPSDFCDRAMNFAVADTEEMIKARAALDEVTAAIRAYEQQRSKLIEDSKQSGVKGKTATHQLAQLDASPIAENLQVALVKAEGAVRMATRRAQAEAKAATDGRGGPNGGSIWWMNRELEEKKRLYGRR